MSHAPTAPAAPRSGKDSGLRRFYETAYAGNEYARSHRAEEHAFFPVLSAFIAEHHLAGSRCLEVGTGRGAFQDIVPDYTGVDISAVAGEHLHKPFCQASATHLPFADSTFDALWSYAVLEHVPGPEQALAEMRRVLRPGGLLLLCPAWQCRPWAADGYPVRPYSDFDLKGKLIKASIPLRESPLFRAGHVLPRRAMRALAYATGGGPTTFRYRPLAPNYDHFWMADSDAVNWMDPYEAILWFTSRGDECLTYRGWLRRFLVRTGAITFRIRKDAP